MIIDGHCHAAGDYSTVESIISTTKKFAIDKILLCTSIKNNLDVKSPPSLPVKKSPDSIFLLNRMLRFAYNHFIKDCGDGNLYVSNLRKQLPDKVIQFLWVNPLDKEQMDNLNNQIIEYQAKGIKLHQAWNAFSIDSVEFNSLAEIAKAHGLPIFIHIYSKSEIAKLMRFAADNRNVIFILAHMLGASLFSNEGVKLDNVFFDTSGSERIQSRDILSAINAFGYDHVVFGTDNPYADIGSQIAKIENLDITDREKDHIFELNIKNILEL